MSVGLVDARRHVLAHVVDGGAAGVADVLVGLEVDAEALRLGGEIPGGGGEEAHHRAVLGRDLAEIHGAVGAAAARHVLDDQLRRAVDVLDEVPREHAGVDVGGGAGVEVDQQRQPLALVERLLRRRRGRGDGGRADSDRSGEQT